jgi:AcrR family transcriptional regulator
MSKSTNINQLFEQALAADGKLPPKQRAIMQAAFDLFAEQGFDHTTTKDIAQRAGVAEGTVYKRYKTKDELLTAILAPMANSVVPSAASEFVAQRINSDYTDLHAYLKAIVDDRVDYAIVNYKYLKIVAERVLADSSFKEHMVTVVGPRVIQPILQTLGDMRDKGLLVDWPLDVLAQFIISTIFGLAFRLILLPQPLDMAAQKRMMVSFLERGLTPEK